MTTVTGDDAHTKKRSLGARRLRRRLFHRRRGIPLDPLLTVRAASVFRTWSGARCACSRL